MPQVGQLPRGALEVEMVEAAPALLYTFLMEGHCLQWHHLHGLDF